MTSVEKELELLDERKKHYRVFDDDTVANLVKYYRLKSNSELLRFIQENDGRKGDTLH